MVTADDVLDVMRSWIGLSKANGTHKIIVDTYNSYPHIAGGYKVKYTDDYCDTTISAAFIKLGAVDLIGGVEVGVERHIELFKKAGIWEEDGSVTPEKGWLIVYNWGDSTQPNDGWADHIGIVESVGGGMITTIEGNINGGKVGRTTIQVGHGNIRGFAKPKYGEAGKSTVEPTAKSLDEIAKEVIRGSWGKGADRRARLTAAGYDYDAVQGKVNAMLGKPAQATTPQTTDGVMLPTLIRGATGEQVKAMQILLIGRDFSCGRYGADGEFGGATYQALKSFQGTAGLIATGICDITTWRKLLGV